MVMNEILKRIRPEQLELARYFDHYYGREVAKNYLKMVTDPNYMSSKKLGAVRHSEKAIERANYLPKTIRPTETWETASKKHIQRVGRELLESNPDIEPKALEKAISKTYPFGQKANYGYRVWREELRAFINQVKFEQNNRWLAESYTPKRRQA